MRIRSLSLLLLGWFGLVGCESLLLPEDPAPTPAAVFEDLWQGFDRYAGNLQSRGLDWDAVYTTYQPRIDAGLDEVALFDTLAAMVYTLRDPHVRLLADFAAFYTFDRLEAEQGLVRTYRPDLVAHYVATEARADGRIRVGRFDEGIGYVYIRDFSGDRFATWFAELDATLDDLQDTAALILDLRGNDGGNGIRARDFAGRFAAERYLYLRTQQRTGPGRDDFADPYPHYITPRGAQPYDRPVVLLTDRFTVSAGERFVLSMRMLPHVTVLGDTTAGTPGSTHERELVNGWRYALSFEQAFAADGFNPEGVGIPPDVYAPWDAGLADRGRDGVLEAALARLR